MSQERYNEEIQKMGLHKDFYKAFKTKANLEGKTMKDLSEEMASDIKEDIKEEIDGLGKDSDSARKRGRGGVDFL